MTPTGTPPGGFRCPMTVPDLSIERLRAENNALKLRIAVLEKALSEAAQNERDAIVRKIRQDAKAAQVVVRHGGSPLVPEVLDALANEIERGEREQVGDEG